MSILRAAGRAWKKYVADVKKATTPRAFDYREQLMLWNFSEEDTLKKWDCISDEEMGGKSFARFEPNGKGSYMITPVSGKSCRKTKCCRTN